MTIAQAINIFIIFSIIISGLIFGLLIGFLILKKIYNKETNRVYAEKEITKKVAVKYEKMKTKIKKEKEKLKKEQKKKQQNQRLLDSRIEKNEGFSEYMCNENGVDMKSYTESVRKTQDKKYNRNKK